ncbi:hypothetical protein ALT1000_450015 [Alteromonas macleodii]
MFRKVLVFYISYAKQLDGWLCVTYLEWLYITQKRLTADFP